MINIGLCNANILELYNAMNVFSLHRKNILLVIVNEQITLFPIFFEAPQIWEWKRESRFI